MDSFLLPSLAFFLDELSMWGFLLKKDLVAFEIGDPWNPYRDPEDDRRLMRATLYGEIFLILTLGDRIQIRGPFKPDRETM